MATAKPKATVNARARIGMIGVLVVSMVIVAALQLERLPFINTGSYYTAYFEDASGLSETDLVYVAGVKSGTIRSISLGKTDRGTKVKVEFSLDDPIALGEDSQAVVKTETVLGRRNLTLISHGPGRIKPGGTIEVQNTISAYSLTDALNDSTSQLEETDTKELDKALRTLSDSFGNTAPQVRAAVDGVAGLSRAIADRNDALQQLLQRANSVTDVIGERSKEINTLVADASNLLGELQARRAAITSLINGTRDVTAQLSAFISENNEQLKPTLEKLNRVLNILQDNKTSIEATLNRIGPFANAVGESVGSGPYWQAFAQMSSAGDYTNVFLNLFRQRYPQAFAAMAKLMPQITMPPSDKTAPDKAYPKSPVPGYPR